MTMKRLRLDHIRAILPALDELEPVLHLLVATSIPDPAGSWSAAGELATDGARVVDGEVVTERAEALATELRDRMAAIYGHVGTAVAAMSLGDIEGAARALLDASELEEGWGRTDRAGAYAEAAFRALGSADAVGHGTLDPAADPVQTELNRIAARALRRSARASRARGDLESARQRYVEGYELARALSDHRGAAEGAIGVGNVFEHRGQWSDARDWYRTALEVLEAVDEPVSERWHALVNLHIVLRSSGALDESLTWLDKAEKEASALGEGEVFLLNARAQLHAAQEEFDRAERVYREALTRADAPAARVTIRLNLAEALLAQERVLDAAETAREAEMEALRWTIRPKMPEVYRLLGRVAAASGTPDSFVFFERALAVVDELGLPPFERAQTLQAYAEMERSRGEHAVAKDLMRQALELYEGLGMQGARQAWVDVYEGDRATTDRPHVNEIERTKENE